MHITFLSSRIDMRIMRLAYAAKAVDIKLHLCVQDCTVSPGMFELNVFDKISLYTNLYSQINHILQEVYDFESALIHCFVSVEYNQDAVLLVKRCGIPVIGDAYDMINTQYTPECHEYAKWPTPQQAALEKYWVERVDGICFRSPYLRFLKEKQINPKDDCIFAHIAEPVISKKYNNFCKKVDRNNFSIYLGYWFDAFSDEFNSIEKYCIPTSYNFYALPYPVFVNKLSPPEYVKLYQNMPYTIYIKFIKKFDMTILTPFKEKDQDCLYPGMTRYIFSNSVVDLIETGKAVFIPKWRLYMRSLFSKLNRVIFFDPEEIYTHKFWTELPGRVQSVLEKPEDISSVDENSAGARMKKFYIEVLRHHHRK